MLTDDTLKAPPALLLSVALSAEDCKALSDYIVAIQRDPQLEATQSAEPRPCVGKGDSRCNYLANCGDICNKCGRLHDGERTPWARAQPAAEPRCEYCSGSGEVWGKDGPTICPHCDGRGESPAPAQPAAEPLSDAEIAECLPLGMADYSVLCGPREINAFARAVIAAHEAKKEHPDDHQTT